jgi:ankyrin repeat protein
LKANVFVHFQPVDHDAMNDLDRGSSFLSRTGERQSPLTATTTAATTTDPFRRRINRRRLVVASEEKTEAEREEEKVAAAHWRELVQRGDVDQVHALLGVDPHRAKVVASTDHNGWSLLHEAVRANNLDMVRLFVDLKADLSAKTASGLTARQIADKFNASAELKTFLNDVHLATKN